MINEFYQSVLDDYSPNAKLIKHSPVGGGCINNAVKLETSQGSFFIKWNEASDDKLFLAEAKGLSLLDTNGSIRVPHVFGNGVRENKAYLLLEWIDSGYSSAQFWEEFGTHLATLHQTTFNHFGLDHNNFIGRLPQSNAYHNTWAEFFVVERVEPQLRLASEKHLIDKKTIQGFDALFQRIENLIPVEPSAFLHGDLWSGNFLVDGNSKPVIIDPAVYYGHRETELAFTYLFGGFDHIFYEAYKLHYPLEEGFDQRIDIHNLYPLLVHVNLFGTSYLSGITQTLKRFT